MTGRKSGISTDRRLPCPAVGRLAVPFSDSFFLWLSECGLGRWAAVAYLLLPLLLVRSFFIRVAFDVECIIDYFLI